MVSADLRQLRHFVVLARTLNFRKAAEQLHTAQPPLSASIRRLEERMGVVLFERNRRGTSLTPAGEQALPHAELSLHHANEFARVAQAAAVGERGHLRMGFIGSATFELLPRVVQLVHGQLPNVDLELTESTTSEICIQLIQGSFDAGLLRYPLAQPQGLGLLPLHRDRFVAAIPASNPLAKRKHIKLIELQHEPFIQYRAASVPGLHAVTMLACQQAGFVPQVQQHANQVQTQVSLVQAGLGVALVPGVVARTPTTGVAFVPLSDAAKLPEIGIALAWAADRTWPLTQRLRELLMQHIAP